MKGLLQSKHFKKNLRKWLIMYVLCMGFFTTLITYSKYISNMLVSSDSARVSKFGIDLLYCDNELCDGSSDTSSDSKYRPYNDIVYYFAADSSNLEVSADVTFTINVDHHFKIKEVSKITADGPKKMENISKNNTAYKTVSFTDSMIAGAKQIEKYRVVVAYDESIVDYDEENHSKIINGIIKDDTGLPQYIFEDKAFDIMSIGYSATQHR